MDNYTQSRLTFILLGAVLFAIACFTAIVLAVAGVLT